MYLCFYKDPTTFKCRDQLYVLRRVNEQGKYEIGVLYYERDFPSYFICVSKQK